MKFLSTMGVILAAGSFCTHAVTAQEKINPLPLNIESADQFYTIKNTGTAAIAYKNVNQITALKTTSNAKTGEATLVIAFKDVPGILKLAGIVGSETCVVGNHNHLEVSESEDNVTYSNTQTISATEGTHELQMLLDKKSRFLKFYFRVKPNGFLNGSYCGHEFNPLTIALPKSVDIPTETLAFQGIAGEVKDTVAVNYSNPTGYLIGSMSDPLFSCRKLSENDEAGKEGTSLFEITYLAENASTTSAVLTVTDSENELNHDVVTIEATSTVDFTPDAPVNIRCASVYIHHAVLNWDKVEGDVSSYRATLYDAADVMIEEQIVEETTCTFENLSKNNTYSVKVIAMATNGNESAESSPIKFTTPADFGAQMLNSGFEYWEGNNSDQYGPEPENWNSFGTVSGMAAAKAKQLQMSDFVRPGSKGDKSAFIYSRTAFGIPANGNLTTGRIRAGSIVAADYGNHNYTDPNDPQFHQIITETPDSATVWVFYKPANPNNDKALARVSMILHGENGDEVVKEPAETVSPMIHSAASLNYKATGEWVRLSIPFEKKDQTDFNDPKFMLASFSTNAAPGVSSGGTDSVYIDDIVLIYNPTLEAGTLAASEFSEGEEFELSFTLSGSMSVSNLNEAANTVYAELSDAFGSFEKAVIVSEPITTDKSGILTVKLPESMISGDNYKLRVVTTNYPMTDEVAEPLNITGSNVDNALEEIRPLSLTISPVPAREKVFIHGAHGASCRIFNIAGKMVSHSVLNENEGINISALTPGVYYVNVQLSHNSAVLKFIKE